MHCNCCILYTLYCRFIALHLEISLRAHLSVSQSFQIFTDEASYSHQEIGKNHLIMGSILEISHINCWVALWADKNPADLKQFLKS